MVIVVLSSGGRSNVGLCNLCKTAAEHISVLVRTGTDACELTAINIDPVDIRFDGSELLNCG